MSRRGKLTDKVSQEIVGRIRRGCYAGTAAACGGIHTATYYRWMSRGEKDAEAGRRSQYRDFCEAVKRAEAEAEAEALAIVREAATGFRKTTTKKVEGPNGTTIEVTETVDRSWQAAAWYLERKYPERWARRDTHTLTGPDGQPVRETVIYLDKEKFLRGDGESGGCPTD